MRLLHRESGRRGQRGWRWFGERRGHRGCRGQPERQWQRGSVTIWGIGMVLLLFGFAGLVVDTWRVFAERQDLAGMADAAVIAGATAVDIVEFRASGEVRLNPPLAEARAREYLARQDTWDPVEISATVVAAPDGSAISVTLEKDVGFTLLGAFLPGEAPLRITIPATANPNVVTP